MVGIALAVAFAVVFHYVKVFFDEMSVMYSDSEYDWEFYSVEDLSESQNFSQWMTTVFMWSGMAMVAAYKTPTLVTDVEKIWTDWLPAYLTF